MTILTHNKFRTLILKWFDLHGRKALPWQDNKTPYRVWISEIMLQQTQVNTVIPYFVRFMREFPDIETLAHAHEDEVLHLWAGLGYYSRARNLHKAAKMMVETHHGEFPHTLSELIDIPGIGPSTAGAILAIAFNQRATILDGNVKRVLARLHGVTEPINEKKIENQLWTIAEKYTPLERVADYTQAMMDLGATVCVRGKPQCDHCPLQKYCVAHQQGIEAQLPAKKATKAIPVQKATFFIFKQGAAVLLQKRPPVGIWGGLWSLPEMRGTPDKKTMRKFCREFHQHELSDYQSLPSFRHTFSHYHLDIFPVLIEIKSSRAATKVMDAAPQIWYNPLQPEPVGLPKPVQMLMRLLHDKIDTLHKTKQRSRRA
jgi:A/G-specific adenine glycosylase